MKISTLTFLIFCTLNTSILSRLSNTGKQDKQLYFKKSIILKTKNLSWKYYHPFADKKYVLAIAFSDDGYNKDLTGDEGQNAVIYF